VIIAPRRFDYPRTVARLALGKARPVGYNPLRPWGQAKAMISGDSCVHTKTQRSVPKMKKLLALMFALALSVSMSSFAFAQAGGDKPMDKPAEKKEEKKEKKAAKTKKAKKEKKDETKKEEAPK
jgi:hypothetical protein